MTFTITFAEPQDVTNPGQDGVQYSFPFTIIDTALIGAPEQKSQTHEHRVIVPICRTRRTGWHLSDSALIRVLFEFGRRHVAELVRSYGVPSDQTLRFPTITTESHPDVACPFDPDAIPSPIGFIMTVEQQRPQIGFHA
jgi:hypothetical protein